MEKVCLEPLSAQEYNSMPTTHVLLLKTALGFYFFFMENGSKVLISILLQGFIANQKLS